MENFHSIDQLHEFLLVHGENLVEMMGDEIDRIEMNLSVCILLLFIHSIHFLLNAVIQSRAICCEEKISFYYNLSKIFNLMIIY